MATNPSKYGNIRTLGPSPDGGQRWYASKLEAAHAFELDLRCKAHDIRCWQPQHHIHFDVNGCTSLEDYVVDFRVWEKNGTVTYHEIKGRQDPKDVPYRFWLFKATLAEALDGIEVLVNP